MVRNLLVLFVTTTIAAACAAPVTVPDSSGPHSNAADSAVVEEPAAVQEDQDSLGETAAGSATESDMGNNEFAATTLTFAGHSDTFLEAIDALLSETGGVESHRYVALTDAAGTAWQGEEIRTVDETIVLLQPVGSGGGIGVELRGAAGADWRPALDSVGLTMDEEVLRPDPEIHNVRVRQTGDGLWSFDVTLAYPDTGWEDYADGWHIATPDGDILATRILLHPHVDEQPFTRGQSNVAVPPGIETVIVRAHTLVRGYGDATVEVALDPE